MNEEFENVLDTLIDQYGGKEYCLSQVLSESEYRNFYKEYRTNNRQVILDKISKLYESGGFDEANIIDIEINSSIWRDYIMKLYFYDKVNYRFFEYNIKTDQVVNYTTFENSTKTYVKSFYTKIKWGNMLWDEFEKYLTKLKEEEQIENEKRYRLFFLEKIKKMKMLTDTEFAKLDAVKAPIQYRDAMARYICDNKYYYKHIRYRDYITFEESEDLPIVHEVFRVLDEKKILSKN
jgi:hypothetical protein